MTEGQDDEYAVLEPGDYIAQSCLICGSNECVWWLHSDTTCPDIVLVRYFCAMHEDEARRRKREVDQEWRGRA